MASFFARTTPTTTQKTFGLKVLYEPASPSSAVTDICFVHGLTGGWDTTWTAEDSTEPWPKTLLSQDISDVRILSWGYDADIVNLWNPASNNRVANHAQNLNGDLARKRDESEHRKLIFVVHSLGGLVVEEALYLSWNSPDEHLRPVARSTVAIAFLGTPHHGADKAAWGRSGVRLASLAGRPNEDMMGLLERGSEMLASIQSRFHGNLRIRRAENNEVAITCFYEEYGYPVIGEIVPQHSAILPGYGQYGLNANHVGMTKFSSRDDNNYDRVLGELQRWVKAQRRALPPQYYQMPALARELSYSPSLLSQTSTYSSPPPLPPRNSTSPYQYIQQYPPPPRDPPSNPATQPAYSVVYPSIQQQAQTDYKPFLAAMGQANNGFPESYQALLKESSEKARRDMAAYITADTASRRGSSQPPVHHHQQQQQQQPSNDSFMQALRESKAQY